MDFSRWVIKILVFQKSTTMGHRDWSYSKISMLRAFIKSKKSCSKVCLSGNTIFKCSAHCTKQTVYRRGWPQSGNEMVQSFAITNELGSSTFHKTKTAFTEPKCCIFPRMSFTWAAFTKINKKTKLRCSKWAEYFSCKLLNIFYFASL